MTPEKQYEYVDFEYLSDMADGETEFIIAMIDTYLTSIPLSIAKLGDAIDSGNKDQIIFFSHKLKGSYNFIGCLQIGKVFARIEDHCETEINIEYLREQLQQVIALSQKITAELEEIMAAAKAE